MVETEREGDTEENRRGEGDVLMEEGEEYKAQMMWARFEKRKGGNYPLLSLNNDHMKGKR